MVWFNLRGDERITTRCSSLGCGGQPIYRLEAGGIGSVYCSGCRSIIEQLPHTHYAGTMVGKDIDTCALCGHDIRSDIHASTATTNKMDEA